MVCPCHKDVRVYGTRGNKPAPATHQIVIEQEHVIVVQRHGSLNTKGGVTPARD